MQPRNNVYYNLGYWFLLLFLLSFVAFYNSYIGVIFQPSIPIIHIHFVLMAIWMVMLIVQPFLIKYKKRSLHKALGKASYVLVPLVLISGFLMIRFSHYRDIHQLQADAARGANQYSDDQILQIAAAYRALPFIWFFWFIIFYALAIVYRRKSSMHARFMLATGLALLGPIIDRLSFKMTSLINVFRLEAIAFLIADIVLGMLLWQDYRQKRSIYALRTALIIYITGQILYFTVPDTAPWKHFVTFIMQPEA